VWEKWSWNEATTAVLNVRRAFFPLDVQLGAIEKHQSEGVSKLVTWLSGQKGFANVEEVLERVGDIHLSDTSCWRTTQKWGEKIQQVEVQQVQEALEKPKESNVALDEEERLGAGMDGCIIHIREEGWKEVKTGCIFQIRPHKVYDERVGEDVMVGHAVNQTYVAHLGGPKEVGEKLFAEARRRNWLQVPNTEVLGDGASWVWNQAEEHFSGSQQAVDWNHALGHLYAARDGLHPPDTLAAQRWLNKHTELLYQGHADQIAQALHTAAQSQPGADAEAGYFETNHRRMQYMQLREEGWVIGSGMVESGCKQFKARLAGPGMRWSRTGAEHLLPIRAAIMGHQFDRIWQTVYNLPPN
jgi:hypothetical protein